MAINVIEIARVGPATDSDSFRDSADWRTLPLTFFDLGWIRAHPNKRIIFYRPPNSTRESFDSVILPKLRLSLSVVLRHYLPLAGRILWGPHDPKPSIIMRENDAVPLTIAQIDADFCLLSGNGQLPAAEFHHLVPELTVSDDSASVLSLQITLFPSQGFSIGITAHHAVLDGRTTSAFIKSWAHVCRQFQEHENNGFASLPDDLTPSFDRTVINGRTDIEAKILKRLSSLVKDEAETRSLKLMPAREIGGDMVRVTLELTRENIEKLRERVKNESLSASSAHGLHLSTFVVAYAYVWTCMVKARGGDAHRPVSFMFPADFRHRLDPPLPATYFGNCVSAASCHDQTAGAFMEERGFVTAVKVLSDLVNGLGQQTVEASEEEFTKAMKAVKSGAQFGSVAGSTRLGYYGADFGWGKPVKTVVVSIDWTGAISMSERRDESGGVEIGLCLKNTEMDIFVSLFNNGLT
ncbi:PREDICTED: phenolic glucoside malonyltransferase 2-like [Tarenaya hassleriana]|uniref:phenolic glucoside malonyltransferase 2-like n=1 Tax=Tarenaya hassleriana TaxID=28532 RepID=UPI00053C31C1|nr:PREDICTED: phenolic glucoside malonyltransferase 2-like [Tarenaya hassleriana]